MGYKYNPFTGNFDRVDSSILPPTVATQYDTDSGSAVPSSNIINFLGDHTQGTFSSASGNTVIYTVTDSTTTQKGVSRLATNAEAIAGSLTTNVVINPSSLGAKLGTQTSKSIPYGSGTSAALSWTSALTNGQIVIGSTSGNPAAANITSTGGTITITNGSNSINLETSGSIATSYVATSGTATPSLGVLNVLGSSISAGTTPVSTLGSGNNLTVQVQKAQAIASTNASNVGLAAFNSAHFSVDANGYVSFSGSTSITINGDTGSATGSTIAFKATPTAGSSVSFSASAAQVNLNVTDANKNTVVGLSAGSGSLTGTNNSGFGYLSLASAGSATNCTAIGYKALNGFGGNDGCTAVGANALLAVFGQRNTAVGSGAIGSSSGTSAAYNTAVGYLTLSALAGGGAFNVAIGAVGGQGAGSAYTTTESSNICINSVGTVGESHVLRIGNGTGTTDGYLNKAFISGINGVTVSNTRLVTIDSSTDQLGTVAYTSIATTYTCNSGSATPSSNTLTINGGSTGLTTSGSGSTVSLAGTLGVGYGGLGITTTPSNGQIPIGNGTTYTAATITAGSGITVTNGSGSITIAATSAATWIDQGSSTTISSNTNYFVTASATLTLPASPSQGDTIIVQTDTGSSVSVTANTGQTIRLGNTTSSTAGSATIAVQGSSLTLTYRSTGTTWHCRAVQGNWVLS